MTDQTKAPDRLWSIVLAGGGGYSHFLLARALLAVSCAKPAVYRDVSIDSLPPSITSQSDNRHVLAGEWEYVDGAVFRLILDDLGNGHYDWKDGRFETYTLIGHTWDGMWVQKENDRSGGFTVDLSPDFSEGEGRWWVNRIGAEQAITQKSGTFHLSKKTTLLNRSHAPAL
ncbi:MAG TPA: hypothetical protein VK901_21240 [Nitrospiraceae bacterium]|nr:hypothetical protein [Nitrospiraceae bacterium]